MAETTHQRDGLADLGREIAEDAVRLARAEIAYAKAQAMDAIKQAAVAIGLFVTAAVLLLLMLVFGLASGAIAVGDALDHPWLGFLIFAAAFLVIGAGLALLGKARLTRSIREGKSTVGSVKEDLAWVKQLTKRSKSES